MMKARKEVLEEQAQASPPSGDQGGVSRLTPLEPLVDWVVRVQADTA